MSNLFINQALLSTVCKELLVDLKGVIAEVPEVPSKLSPELVKNLQMQSGIANSAKMRSVKRFYQLLIEVFKKYETVEASAADLEVIRRALRFLANHLDEIVHAQKNTPIALTNVFTKLELLVNRNSANTISGELFLPCTPDWSLLPDRDTAITSDEFKAAIKQHLNTYVDACSKFTKDSANVENASILRQVLVTLEPKVPYKAYWLVFDSAIAILDRVIKTGNVDNMSKWVAARMKSELDSILAGGVSPDEANLSMLLYFVAKYPSDSSARIKKLKENYQLANFLADPSGVDPENVAKFQQVLARLNEVWEQTIKQDRLDSVSRFIVDLAKNAGVVKNPGFTVLIDTLKLVVEAYPSMSSDESVKKEFALKGATALLLLEKQLKEGSSLEQATNLANDLRQMFKLELLEAVTSTDDAARARAQIFKDLVQESLSDLEVVKDELQSYFSGNHDKKDIIMQTVQMQRQIFNSVLGRDNSLSLAFVKFGELIQPTAQEKEQFELVGILTKLGQFVEMLKSSEKSALEAAQKWLNSFNIVETLSEEDLIDAPKEEDLIEIFLEEAKDILVNLKQNLKNLKSDFYDFEQLKQIHRYFHTLKGSGRMIGLRHFGDVMFAVEDLLKRWNRTAKPATTELYKLLTEATEMVEKDVQQLEKNNRIVVSAKHILEMVNVLEGNADAAPDAPAIKVVEKTVDISLVPSQEPSISIVAEEPSLSIVVEEESTSLDIFAQPEENISVSFEDEKPVTLEVATEIKVEEVKEVSAPITLALAEEPVKEEVKPIKIELVAPKVEEVKPVTIALDVPSPIVLETPSVQEPVIEMTSIVLEEPIKVKEEVVKAPLVQQAAPVVEPPKVQEKVKVEESKPIPEVKEDVKPKPTVVVPDAWQQQPKKKEGFFARLLKMLFGKK